MTGKLNTLKDFTKSTRALTPMLLVALMIPPSTIAAESRPAPDMAADRLMHGPVPDRMLNLEECFQKADQFNREIISAKWNLTIAKAAVRIAGALPNPIFQFQSGYGPTFTSLFTGQTQQLYWTQQFQTAGKRSKKLSVARANLRLAELKLEALRFDVHNRVRRAYAEMAAAEAYENLIEAQRSVSVKLLEIATKRFQSGKAPKSEVIQANLSVLQFDTLRNQAATRLQQGSTALALITGERPERVEVIDVNDNGIFKLASAQTELVPPPQKDLPAVADLIDKAYRSRPDLIAARQQVEANQRAVTLAKSQRIPDLFAGAGFTYATFSPNQTPGLGPQRNWLGSGAFINISFTNPIFYQNQGEIKQAAALWRKAQRQLDLSKAQASAQIVTAYNAVGVARDNIFVFQKDLLPTAAQVARLARRAYQVGAADLSSAIVAQQQYQQTLSSYFDAVVSYQNAWADLEKAVGLPLRL